MSEYQIQKALGTTKQFWVSADVMTTKQRIYMALLVEAVDKDHAISCVEKFLRTEKGKAVIIKEVVKELEASMQAHGLGIDRIGVLSEQEKNLYEPDLFQE